MGPGPRLRAWSAGAPRAPAQRAANCGTGTPTPPQMEREGEAAANAAAVRAAVWRDRPATPGRGTALALPELLAHRKRQRRQRVSTGFSCVFVCGEVSGDRLPPLPGSRPYRAPVCWRSRRNRHHAQEAESARPVARQPNGQGTSRNANCLDRRLSSEPPPSKHASPSVPAWSPPARSGSERPRPPPQVGPQPMHPVRQNISGHSEVCGDIGVPPAVYDPVLQQPAVVRGQVPEEGAKSVNSYGSHWGDLGGQDDTPGQAGFPGVLFLPSGRFGPRHTWEYLQAQRKASEVPKLSISSCGDAPQGGWGFQRLLFGRGCGLSAPGSRQGYGFTAAHDFWSTKIVIRW